MLPVIAQSHARDVISSQSLSLGSSQPQ